MKLQELIDANKKVEKENREAVQESEDDIEKYLRSQTVTVQEIYDIVAAEWRPMDTSSGQVSTWQILNIAKKAILNRRKKWNT